MYVYIQSFPELYTVGFYSPDGKWHTDSDHGTKDEAAKRVHWLNGGKQEPDEIDEGGSYSEYKNRYPNRGKNTQDY